MKKLLLPSLLVVFFSAVVGIAFAASPPKDSKSNEGIKAMRVQTRVVKAKDSAKEFEDELEALRKKLADEKDPRRRYEEFAEASSKLAKIKDGPRPDSEEKSIEMALVLETFEGLPSKSKYDPKECSAHLEKAQSRMENLGGDEPQDPGVVKGLQILKMVCGSLVPAPESR